MAAPKRADKAEIAETDIAERFSQSEVASYIADMAKELAALSKQAGLEGLSALLGDANREALRALQPREAD